VSGFIYEKALTAGDDMDILISSFLENLLRVTYG
jgi:hypothetical protein